MAVLIGIVLAFSVLIPLTSCDSDNDADGEEGVARIQGNVAQVLMAAKQPGEPSSLFTQWKSLFTVPVAYAQENMLEGITVTVLQGGVVLATDETNAQGDFVLEFSGEETITLQFATPTFTVSTSLDVVSGSTVVIVVNLSDGGDGHYTACA